MAEFVLPNVTQTNYYKSQLTKLVSACKHASLVYFLNTIFNVLHVNLYFNT